MAQHSGTVAPSTARRTLPQHRMFVAGDDIITAKGTFAVASVELHGSARVIVANDPQNVGNGQHWFGEHDVILDRHNVA